MKISVKKFDPSVQVEPYVETYEVAWKEHITVLEAIVRIHEDSEPLAFEYSCRGRQCGRCAVMLDGVPVLACVTTLEDGDHLLEPLKGHPVIRDLTIDRSSFHASLSNLRRRIRTTEITEDDVFAQLDPALCEKVDPFEWCARCGVCNAGCSALNMDDKKSKFIGPAGLVAIAHRHFDPYDQGDRVLQAVSEGLYECIMCGNCDKVCSSLEIHHLDTWKELRAEAESKGLGN